MVVSSSQKQDAAVAQATASGRDDQARRAKIARVSRWERPARDRGHDCERQRRRRGGVDADQSAGRYTGQPDLTPARPPLRSVVGLGPELADHRGTSKLVPGLPLGGINTVWSSELGLHSQFEFTSAPQPQCLVDDSATVQIGVSGDMGIDTGQQVGIQGRGDLGAATGADVEGTVRSIAVHYARQSARQRQWLGRSVHLGFPASNVRPAGCAIEAHFVSVRQTCLSVGSEC